MCRGRWISPLFVASGAVPMMYALTLLSAGATSARRLVVWLPWWCASCGCCSWACSGALGARVIADGLLLGRDGDDGCAAAACSGIAPARRPSLCQRWCECQEALVWSQGGCSALCCRCFDSGVAVGCLPSSIAHARVWGNSRACRRGVAGPPRQGRWAGGGPGAAENSHANPAPHFSSRGSEAPSVLFFFSGCLAVGPS